MYVTLKELKKQPGRIVSMVENGEECIITARGTPKAKIVPLIKKEASNDEALFKGFGIWEDREDMEDVDKYLRDIRRGRKL